jgi:hypothetical protein
MGCLPTDVPRFVPKGAHVPIKGSEHWLVLYSEATSPRVRRVGFEHLCDRGDKGTIICAPALQLDGGGHTWDPVTVTVTPSILCPDCGTHGFVRNGEWIPA